MASQQLTGMSTGIWKAASNVPFVDQDFTTQHLRLRLGPVLKQPSLHAHPSHVPSVQSDVGATSTETRPSGRIQPDRFLHVSKATTPTHGPRVAYPYRDEVIREEIVANHLPREETRQGIEHPVLSSDADNIRRKAEGSYYEQEDANGQIRRRSMIRTVSKEDYLFGRGANPRTGVVTPGGGSIDSNSDVLEDSPKRIVTPAKWRQKGDEWISLNIGEPTPLTSTAQTRFPSRTRTRRPQTPAYLCGSSFESPIHDSVVAQSPCLRSKEMDSTIGDEDLQRGLILHTPLAPVPGSRPRDLEKHHSHLQINFPGPGSEIRRKPVGQSPSNLQSGLGTASVLGHHAQYTMLSPPLHDGNRSFTMPNLRKAYRSSDNAVNPSPKLQGTGNPGTITSKPHLDLSESSFLGPRSQTLMDLNQTYSGNINSNRKDLDKELPCLPTSNGQFLQSHSWKRTADPLSLAQETHTQRIKAYQRQTRNTTMAWASGHHGPIAVWTNPSESMEQNRTLERPIDSGLRPVRDYENSPRYPTSRPRRTMVAGPRQMPRVMNNRIASLIPHDITAGPQDITSMNTSMYTPTSKTRAPRQQRDVHNLAQTGPPYRLPQRSVETKLHMTEMPPSRHSMWTRQASPTAQSRGLDRPQMPSRAAGMQQVPRVTNTQDNSAEIHTDSQNQLNPTGMLLPRPRETSCLQTALFRDTPLARTEDCPPQDGKIASLEMNRGIRKKDQTKGCSRCHSLSESMIQLNTDGQVDDVHPRNLSVDSACTLEPTLTFQVPTPVTEVTEPWSDDCSKSGSAHSETTSATMLDAGIDLRDHSICCPDCCKLDCHEGCLGHPRPGILPVNASREGESLTSGRTRSSSPSRSASGVSSACMETVQSKNKPGFLASIFKSVFWHPSPRASSPRTITDVLNKSEERLMTLDHSPIKTSSLKSTGTDRCREGAILAAKKAMGFDTPPTPSNETLHLKIARRRPGAKSRPITKVGNIAAVPDQGSSSYPLTTKTSAAANESRKLSGGRSCSGAHAAISRQTSQSRTISGSSVDIQVPSMGGMGFADFFEVFFIVPVEATRMWLHKNPQVIGLVWSAIDCCWNMTCVVATTARLVFHVIYVYSKTGKYKAKRIDGEKVEPWSLVVDMLRSALYLLIFTSMMMILRRMLVMMLLPFRIFLTMGRYVFTVSKQSTLL